MPRTDERNVELIRKQCSHYADVIKAGDMYDLWLEFQYLFFYFPEITLKKRIESERVIYGDRKKRALKSNKSYAAVVDHLILRTGVHHEKRIVAASSKVDQFIACHRDAVHLMERVREISNAFYFTHYFLLTIIMAGLARLNKPQKQTISVL